MCCLVANGDSKLNPVIIQSNALAGHRHHRCRCSIFQSVFDVFTYFFVFSFSFIFFLHRAIAYFRFYAKYWQPHKICLYGCLVEIKPNKALHQKLLHSVWAINAIIPQKRPESISRTCRHTHIHQAKRKKNSIHNDNDRNH